jgi:hypothetical protein
MEILHTDPDQIAVPFAELAAAARAWDDAGRQINEGLGVTPAQDTSCCGPQVGPVLAARLARWRRDVTGINSAVGDQADALRACAAASAMADADVARRFG